MLVAVDDMADIFAVELPALTNPDLDTSVPSVTDDTIEVKVRATGPKYALAVDSNGRQGLIPAFSVRKLKSVLHPDGAGRRLSLGFRPIMERLLQK